MQWQTQGVESVYNPATGEYSEPIPGELVQRKCRFHLGGTKVYKNQDSTDVNQVGTIRLDAGGLMPSVNDTVNVIGHFTGKVREVYRGQLSWRIEV